MGTDLLRADRSIAPRVIVVSLMKSGTHLMQELMVNLGYGIYGHSRVTKDIRPRFDRTVRRELALQVYGQEVGHRLDDCDEQAFSKITDDAWHALGWAWQERLGMPLVNRYGSELTNNAGFHEVSRRLAGMSFSNTPGGVCWIFHEFKLDRLDGKFLREWTETGDPLIIFNFRDPRDLIVSMVNFLAGRTMQGVGIFSEFQVLNKILSAKACLEEQITYALTDPSFPITGLYENAVWLLHHPAVCKVNFESLVGERGGGSAGVQLATVRRIIGFLGSDESAAAVAEKIYRTDAFSFFNGQIGSWREVFTPKHRRLFADRFGGMLKEYGYAEHGGIG